jgi:hypothetical protein
VLVLVLVIKTFSLGKIDYDHEQEHEWDQLPASRACSSSKYRSVIPAM